MNILQINTKVTRGGAARVMYRLHHALRQTGHQSRIAARSVHTPEEDVFSLADLTLPQNPLARRVIRAVETRAEKWFSYSGLHATPKALFNTPLFQESDIVHLHNLHGNYFNYRYLDALSGRKPLVWTLHDMWAFTGHCAYAYDCQRWRAQCGHCPLLKGKNRLLVQPTAPFIDHTHNILQEKRRVYSQTKVEVVTPSLWLQKLAQESIIGLGRTIHYIPSGLDLNIFKPVAQAKSRAYFGIPPGKKVVLFSAEKTSNFRKGFAYLREAIQSIQPASEFVLLVMGHSEEADFPGFQVIKTGYLEEESIQVLAYNAADLLVFPSLADNQPLGVLESLACGTPVVAFDVGGIPEMVRHMKTGYLARYKNTKDLSHGIQTLLMNPQQLQAMKAYCRQVAVDEYDLKLQASRYLALYEETITRHNSHLS